MIRNAQVLRALALVLTFIALCMSASAAIILDESAWTGERQKMSSRVIESVKESEVEFMRHQKVEREEGEAAPAQ